MTEVSRGIDRIEVTFDEPNLVANAGLLLVVTVTVRLGLERLINATVDLSGRVGGALPGRKVLTLVHAMAAGGSPIDHADMLRSGATGAVLGHRVMAPSTLGTFLRAFTFGQATIEATRPLGIDLRMGLHTGECEVRGDDLCGLAVHIAARVGSLAAPGEVLVSGTVKDLVVGSDIEFWDRGKRELKGVPGTWKLFAVKN